MRKIPITILLLISLSAFAQNENVSKEDLQNGINPLNEKIKLLQSENGILKKEIGTLNLKISNTTEIIDSLVLKHRSLQAQTESNSSAIAQASNELEIKIKETGDRNDGKITEVSESLSKNSLYGIIAVLLAIVLSGFLYWLLSKRQRTDKTDFIDQLANTKSTVNSIEKKLLDEYNKQVNGIEKLSDFISDLNKGKEPSTIQDHSLTLKVADEITRINAFANTLDPSKQEALALKNSVKRIIDNFKVNNYEIVDLLGHKYDDRLKIIVVGEAIDPNLKQGEEIITRIVKPLVKFNGIQIQAAQVEISIGQ